jgi:hypothetical protein
MGIQKKAPGLTTPQRLFLQYFFGLRLSAAGDLAGEDRIHDAAKRANNYRGPWWIQHLRIYLASILGVYTKHRGCLFPIKRRPLNFETSKCG